MVTAIGERQRQARHGARLNVKALVVFFALAYALSWSWAIPLAAAHLVVRRGVGWPTHLPALLGPAIAALVVTAWTMGRPGVRDLGARLVRWRVPVRWWLVAVSPVAFLGLALAAVAVAGQALPSVGDFGRFSGTPAIGLAGVLLIIFAGAVGEETGWRGYALPQLQRRFSPLASSLILAGLWFGWHLPQFWVIATYRDFAPAGYVGMFLRAGLRRGRTDLAVQPFRRQHLAGRRLARALQPREWHPGRHRRARRGGHHPDHDPGHRPDHP